MISLSVIIIGFSADVGYILGDTTEHCSTFKGTRTRAAFVFVIGFLMLDLANNTVQVLISTNLVMLYFAYGWLLETSWDFQLVLVGVDIDGFLSWKVELVVKPVLILKQHFLWQLWAGSVLNQRSAHATWDCNLNLNPIGHSHKSCNICMPCGLPRFTSSRVLLAGVISEAFALGRRE
ncbi:hypothetical protein V6N11_073660 [Hibiscus sabdariffa]|uniref:Uncharacterized protein n=1 Tax=Hibiscus sabdariffa TaxID=183260 RepID=A0ABR2NU62_9ROSI